MTLQFEALAVAFYLRNMLLPGRPVAVKPKNPMSLIRRLHRLFKIHF